MNDENEVKINRNLTPEWFKKEAEKYENINKKAQEAYKEFQEKYSIKKLKELEGETLINYLFGGKKHAGLNYDLESNPKYSSYGKASVGSSYGFGLYFDEDVQCWKSDIGEEGKKAIKDISEAIEKGSRMRDMLVKSIEIVEEKKLDTTEDYNELYNELNNSNEEDLKKFITTLWFLKFLHMMFPEKFASFYEDDWQHHVLYNSYHLCKCKIEELKPLDEEIDNRYTRIGQINSFVQKCGISNAVFEVIIKKIISWPRTFYNICIRNLENIPMDWQENRYVGLPLDKISMIEKKYNQKELIQSEQLKALREEIKEKYHFRSRKDKGIEMKDFIVVNPNNAYVVVTNKSNQLLGIGIFTGNYYYKKEEFSHRRPIKWLKILSVPKKLPVAEGDINNIFFKMNKKENIEYLYSVVYSDNIKSKIDSDTSNNESSFDVFHTGYVAKDAKLTLNRILFGAPGTGKSWQLNQDRKKLLVDSDNDYERVTFHPDYTYANFVGTYKPVPMENGMITYKYVPGPFMRIYVKTIKDNLEGNIKPHLLLIEEINRAKVSAVFGDIFQLLDRNEKNVSEYPIAITEDMRNYLEEEFKRTNIDCSKLRIPDNMYIWATMNSADQGVYPMDTAFKRRWDFTYIDIDNKEEDIKGKFVLIGNKKVEWNSLRVAINNKLSELKINEDKLLGPFFISKKIIDTATNENNFEIDKKLFYETFKGKVLMYLFEDAAKQKRASIFSESSKIETSRYSAICKAFDEKGLDIFCSSIKKELGINQNEEEED